MSVQGASFSDSWHTLAPFSGSPLSGYLPHRAYRRDVMSTVRRPGAIACVCRNSSIQALKKERELLRLYNVVCVAILGASEQFSIEYLVGQ